MHTHKKQTCWHYAFHRLEINRLRLMKLFRGFLQGVQANLSRLALMAVVLGLMSRAGAVNSPDVFVCLLYLLLMTQTVLCFPVQTVQQFGELLKSVKVLESFLLLDEKKDQIKDLRPTRSIHYYNEPDADWAVDIDHMTARWPLVYVEGARRFKNKRRSRSSTSSMKSLLGESGSDHAFSLKYMSLQVKKKELLAVVGIVGSGKSSLLMSLIAELPFDIGQISINGKISYYSQMPWIFGGVVRDNILFGKEYNATQYQTVVDACGLTRDFELLPNGDMTFVGERGLQLSGGQKARISLARCIYQDADIVLLDDPLTAVDASVGGHIFERCIETLLKEKTVVLVTHQLQYLKRCDRIVVLRDGSIHDVGTYDELKGRGMDMKAVVATDPTKQVSEAALEAEEEEKQILLENNVVESGLGEEEEEVVVGAVGLRTYWEYFHAGFGHFLLPLIVPLWLAGPALFCFSDWMLAKWITEQSGNEKTSTTTEPFDPLVWGSIPSSLQLYLLSLASSVGVFIAFAIVYHQMASTASHRLHNKMLASIVNSTCRFFDTHPAGQVLNRFSRDLGIIDDTLPMIGYIVSLKTVQFIGLITVTVIVNPWLLIACVPLVIIIVVLRFYALRTLRHVKRLEAKVRSPVFSHVSDTVLGLETIRALGKQDQYLAEFDRRQNQHTSAFFLYLSSHRWMSVRMLLILAVYLNIIIFISLQLVGSVDGNLLALSLIYCISLGEPFEFYMRITTELENLMTSVERVVNYFKLEQEPAKLSDKPLSPDWPARGAITFSKTSLKYSEDGPPVLKMVDCHIKGREKIGIVGRTGSGKSSLISALFRLAEPTGMIFIDGTDVSKVGLHDLRKKMSIIPQDPVLFGSSLRWNLDPLEEFSDERLWKALEQVHMKNRVSLMPNKLYTEIKEGGKNLSVGQRQLICLARAILKCNTILVLDEATANVDEETDAIIQKTIRSRFRDSTVLTIAHRLYTVMDCDRIMVLSDGEMKEFDTPYNLLQDDEGYFTGLIRSLGRNQAKQLLALAEISQHKRMSANLQHQRAVMLATEQLAQSMEDLRQGQAALNWNRFNLAASTDSMDKIDPDSSITESQRKPALGPSQKIIRRRSPARVKNTAEDRGGSESNELMSYDSPPRTLQSYQKRQRPNHRGDNKAAGDGGRENGADDQGRNDKEGGGYHGSAKLMEEESSSPSPSKDSVEYENDRVLLRNKGRRADVGFKKYQESDVDAPLANRPQYPSSSSPVDDNRKKESPVKGRRGERNSSSASNRPLLQRDRDPDPDNTASLPSNIRLLSGVYRPVSRKEEEDEREQFV